MLSLEYTSRIYRVARAVRDTCRGKAGYGIVVALPKSQLNRYEMGSYGIVDEILSDMGFEERHYIAVDGAYYELISLEHDNSGEYR